MGAGAGRGRCCMLGETCLGRGCVSRRRDGYQQPCRAPPSRPAAPRLTFARLALQALRLRHVGTASWLGSAAGGLEHRWRPQAGSVGASTPRSARRGLQLRVIAPSGPIGRPCRHASDNAEEGRALSRRMHVSGASDKLKNQLRTLVALQTAPKRQAPRPRPVQASAGPLAAWETCRRLPEHENRQPPPREHANTLPPAAAAAAAAAHSFSPAPTQPAAARSSAHTTCRHVGRQAGAQQPGDGA